MARFALQLADHRIEMVYLLSKIFDQSMGFMALPFDSNLAAEPDPFDSLTTHDAHHSLPLRSRCANQGHRPTALQLDDLRALERLDRSGASHAFPADWRSRTSLAAYATRCHRGCDDRGDIGPKAW